MSTSDCPYPGCTQRRDHRGDHIVDGKRVPRAVTILDCPGAVVS